MGEQSERNPISEEERARLAEIARLGLTRAAEDPVFKAFVEQAARELGLPIGLISVVLDDTQFFFAQVGLSGWLDHSRGTPREWAFCEHAVRSRQPFVVYDAPNDARVRNNPLVREDGIVAYAGAPLITERGQAVGTLCVIGTEPRTFEAHELERLQELGRHVVAHLEKQAAARRQR